MTQIRTGQAPAPLDRQTCHLRFVRQFTDPAYAPVQDAIAQIEDIAWDAYHRRAARTASSCTATWPAWKCTAATWPTG